MKAAIEQYFPSFGAFIKAASLVHNAKRTCGETVRLLALFYIYISFRMSFTDFLNTFSCDLML
jgi:hypothetical protein